MILYGIPNCDTVAKARKYLESNAVAYTFHDVRQQGLPLDVIEQAYQALGEKVFNTRSPSWRELSDEDKNALRSGQDFSAAQTKPTVLKRPLVFHEGTIFNGFKIEDWQARGL
ncbi:MAG: ArsC/Spx/MgsR family protein [Litorivicinus sp.]